MSKVRPIPGNSSFGFIFQMVPNGGGGGASPKTYSVTDPANQFLEGFTDDNAAPVSRGWPSDPGDSTDPVNRTPPASRAYIANQSPNNIRLSQVSLVSIRYSHGIWREKNRQYLPTSTFFDRDLSGAPANNEIIGDLSGCRRITVTLIDDATAGNIPPFVSLIANGIGLGLGTFRNAEGLGRGQMPVLHTFHLNNLGAVQVTNLSAAVITVGVHVELSL